MTWSRDTVDFGRRSADYVRHRPGMPDSFYERLDRWIDLAGANVVDLGTGPGLTALALARRGATVAGVDVSENQIEAARAEAAERKLHERCTFRVAPAEDTGLPGGSFDAVTATQCWVWFDHDRALAEVRRLLRQRGLLIVAHYNYQPRLSAVAAATEQIIRRYNPDWTMADNDGLYPKHIEALSSDGFDLVEQFCYDEDHAFTHEAWRGRMRTCNAIGSGVLDPDAVDAFDRDVAALLQRDFPDEPVPVRHRIWAIVARRREDAA